MEDEKVKQFFTELKELCHKHKIITVGYKSYATGKALGFEFEDGCYFVSGLLKSDGTYSMAYEPADKSIEV